MSGSRVGPSIDFLCWAERMWVSDRSSHFVCCVLLKQNVMNVSNRRLTSFPLLLFGWVIKSHIFADWSCWLKSSTKNSQTAYEITEGLKASRWVIPVTVHQHNYSTKQKWTKIILYSPFWHFNVILILILLTLQKTTKLHFLHNEKKYCWYS